ncbi:MAG TPA: universal stress protein [Candidatus Acidoferrales bacterium]|nr:universal stress protein [Candidatus Acidoferrales bacterium]
MRSCTRRAAVKQFRPAKVHDFTANEKTRAASARIDRATNRLIEAWGLRGTRAELSASLEGYGMNMLRPESLLVAVDFSSCSQRALQTALSWRTEQADVTVLHVIDSELARDIEAAGFGSYAEVVAKLRADSEQRLTSLRSAASQAFETMVVEGLPFAEIVRIANDLDCDLIVMGTHGDRPGVAQILFGSTAEKVVRASRAPVLCVP